MGCAFIRNAGSPDRKASVSMYVVFEDSYGYDPSAEARKFSTEYSRNYRRGNTSYEVISSVVTDHNQLPAVRQSITGTPDQSSQNCATSETRWIILNKHWSGRANSKYAFFVHGRYCSSASEYEATLDRILESFVQTR